MDGTHETSEGHLLNRYPVDRNVHFIEYFDKKNFSIQMNFCQEFSIWGAYFYILENILLGLGAPCGCVGAFYWKEGGI
jgi:hypothetical protein